MGRIQIWRDALESAKTGEVVKAIERKELKKVVSVLQWEGDT